MQISKLHVGAYNVACNTDGEQRLFFLSQPVDRNNDSQIQPVILLNPHSVEYTYIFCIIQKYLPVYLQNQGYSMVLNNGYRYVPKKMSTLGSILSQSIFFFITTLLRDNVWLRHNRCFLNVATIDVSAVGL